MKRLKVNLMRQVVRRRRELFTPELVITHTPSYELHR